MDFPTRDSQAAAPGPKRREGRLPAMLNVRILGMDADGKPFHQPATTTEISSSGARVTGLAVKLIPGDIVGLQSGGEKARFKVSWVRVNRDGSYQAGLRCLEKGASPWRDRMLPPTMGDDRRSEDRYACNGSASLRAPSMATPIWATLRDVSSRGCYVQSVNVLQPGDILYGQFTIQNTPLNAIVEVRSSIEAVGMGLLWCDLGCDGAAKLDRVLRDLAIHSVDSTSSKAQAFSHLDKVHQLLAAVRERLDNDRVTVNADTLAQLSEAQTRLAAALKSVQP